MINVNVATAARGSDAPTKLNSLGFAKSPQETRVVAAMSGGVDSSVAAALLKREGYDVVGVTLQLYDHGSAVGRKGACCAGKDIHDARDVAARIGIPHYVLDYEERFRRRVIDDFAASYAKGETPVPCIACNQKIKFADLLDTATELGADALATGHYVRARHDHAHPQLFRATDAARDQSYFLFATTQQQLERLRFPLGSLTKQAVRELARSLDLEIAEKADSQDICFVPSGHYSDLVERLRPDAAREGAVVHVDGRVLGQHKGLFRFTVGQRKGLGVVDPANPTEPLFVIALDAASNRLTVGPRSALATIRATLRDLNWIGHGFAGVDALDALSPQGIDIAVRVRSTRAPVRARLTHADGCAQVAFAAGEEGVAPGQACVFYSSTDADARVLGGGFIKTAQRAVLADQGFEAAAAQGLTHG